MFGPRRKKIQVKSVEDYLKGEDARIPGSEGRTATPSAIPAKVKPFVAQAVVILFILALMLVAFSQLSTLRSQVAALQIGKEGEAQELKMQMAELAVKLDKSRKQVDSLVDSVAGLQRELEAEKSLRVRAETAAAAAKKVPTPDKNKKPAKPAAR
jgi:hypothetical protein